MRVPVGNERHPFVIRGNSSACAYVYRPTGDTSWGAWEQGQEVSHAATPSGTYALGLHPTISIAILGSLPVPIGENPLVELRLFDRAEPGKVTLSPLPASWKPGSSEPVKVTWDGEHYQVMAFAGGGAEVALYDAMGTLVAEPKLVLEDFGSVFVEADYRTDPVSGDTWWSYPRSPTTAWIAGWDRELQALTPDKKGVLVDSKVHAVGGTLGLSVDETGVLVASGSLDYWSAFKMNRQGEVEWLHTSQTREVTYPNNSSLKAARGFRFFAPFRRLDGAWSVLASDLAHTYRYDFDAAGNIGPASVVTTYSRCDANLVCSAPGVACYYHSIVQADGETWLGFKDNSLAHPQDKLPDPQQWYRMIKIEAGCQSASMWDLTQGGTVAPPPLPGP